MKVGKSPVYLVTQPRSMSMPRLFCIFFFSRRRRHTRLVSDWSSDVCSSDLSTVVLAPRGQIAALEHHGSIYLWNLRQGKLVGQLAGMSPAFSADGKLLVARTGAGVTFCQIGRASCRGGGEA